MDVYEKWRLSERHLSGKAHQNCDTNAKGNFRGMREGKLTNAIRFYSILMMYSIFLEVCRAVHTYIHGLVTPLGVATPMLKPLV